VHAAKGNDEARAKKRMLDAARLFLLDNLGLFDKDLNVKNSKYRAFIDAEVAELLPFRVEEQGRLCPSHE